MNKLITIISISFIALALNATAFASDYFVDAVNGDNSNTGTLADDAWQTITHAIENASASQNDPAVINIAPGTYDMALGENYPIFMGDYIRFIGSDPEATILDATGSDSPVIRIAEVDGVMLQGLKITGGMGLLSENYRFGGGLYILDSDPVIDNCIITGNIAEFTESEGGIGGGICIELDSYPKITNCTISNNGSSWGGGLTCSYGAKALIENCVISDNEGYQAGGLSFYSAGDVEVSDCIISGNTGKMGGGIQIDNSSPTIKGCTFENNSVETDEGYYGVGGGIFIGGNKNINPVITDNEFKSNKAIWGGAVSVYGEVSITIEDSLFDNNYTESIEDRGNSGGGIYLSDVLNAEINGCVFSNNSSFFGGALFIKNNLNSEINDCDFSDNDALIGGGIYFTESKSTIENSVFENNVVERVDEVGGGGAGIYCSDCPSIKVENCQLKSNKAMWGGGLYYEYSKSSVNKTVFENNSADYINENGGMGGAINCVYESKIDIDKSIFKNNEALGGGGVNYFESEGSITDTLFEKNSAGIYNQEGGQGGAVYINKSSVNVEKCRIIENYAFGGSGGIGFELDLSSKIKNCIFTGNTAEYFDADGSGAGIQCMANSNIEVINCLLTENNTNKGGAFCFIDSEPKVSNCTIYNNSATLGGAYYSYRNSNPEFINCIIYKNDIDKDSPATVTYSNIEGGYDGEGNIDQEPAFTTGPRGDYYLSCMAAGDDCSSPCIDAGSPEGIEGFNHKDYITRGDGVVDTGVADMGFHYIPHINFGLGVSPVQFAYKVGDEISLNLDLETAPVETISDVYLLLMTPEGKFLPGMTWSPGLKPLVSGITLPADLAIESSPLFTFTLPDTNPPVDDPGWYTFYITALKPGTVDFISNIASTAFQVK